MTSLDGHGTPTVIRLSGEIDMANVGEQRARILAAGPARAVVLDLDDVEYLDSAGINMLDDLSGEFAANGWSLAIVCGPDAVCRRVLELGAPGLLLQDGV